MLQFLKGKRDQTVPLAISAEELSSRQREFYIVDLRDLSEFRQGHIKGAHLIPYLEFTKRTHELPTAGWLAIVDAKGGRARQTAKLLQQDGFDVRYLKGGMRSWAGKTVK